MTESDEGNESMDEVSLYNLHSAAGGAQIRADEANKRIDELEQTVAELTTAFHILERTLYGVQQMLGKAAEYKGKPRGRLPR